MKFWKFTVAMVMFSGSEIMSCEKFAIPYLDITDMPNIIIFL